MSPQELDQARTSASAAQAKLDALKKQVDAQRATVFHSMRPPFGSKRWNYREYRE